MTSTWIAVDDREVDGDVELVSVRNQHGVQGIRLRPREGDIQDFDHYYAEIANHPAVPIIERTPGEVIFASCTPPATIDVHAVALDVLEAIRGEPRLPELSSMAFQLGEDGRVRIVPRWRSHDAQPTGIAAAHFLLRIAGESADPRVEAAIEALLDPSPEIRQTARSLLNTERVQPERQRVRYAVTARERQIRGLGKPEARAVVVIEPEVLHRLDPAKRSAAAGLAGLPTSALDGLVAAGLPLVLESHGRAAAARIAADRIQRQTGLPVTSAAGGSMFTLLAASALGTTGLVTATGSLMLAAVGLFTLPVVGGVTSLGLLGVTAWSLHEWNQDRRRLQDANDAAKEAREERSRHGAHPGIGRGWSVLGEARSALATTRLPPRQAGAVRSVLAATERELIRMVERNATVQRGLANASSAEVRERIEAIDEADESQSRRLLTLTETLQELEGLEEERESLLERSAALTADLTLLERAVAAWEPERPLDAIDAAVGALGGEPPR